MIRRLTRSLLRFSTKKDARLAKTVQEIKGSQAMTNL
jgi:hypothetical protein